MSTSIYLLDVDGVLLHPGGYREALKRTINHFSRAMGWGDCAPEDSTALVFEAHGITNEWDMSAICLAALFVAARQYVSDLQLPRSVPDALAVVRKYGVPPQQVDFAQTARDVSAQMRSGEKPALAAPVAFSLALNSSSKGDSRSNLTALLDEILSTTCDIHRSHTLPVFQTYALGSVAFEETYSLDAPFDTASMILEHDRPSISRSNREYLLHAAESDEIKSVVFTARPSLPPRETQVDAGYYAPEAELAVQMLELETLPMIGYGRVQWLAREFGVDPDLWVKPAPLHALAAIGAAVSGDEKAGLLGAQALVQEGRLQTPFSELMSDTLNVTVFEDSARGVLGAMRGVEILRACGAECRLLAKGIATHPEKCANLEKVGARVFADVDAALCA